MNPKTLTLIIAAIAIVADASTTIAGLLPPAWALVVGALVAGLVAIDRALHNVAQGVSLKSYLTSPSAWAAALVIVASIISAVAGVVPVTYAAGIAVFSGMVLRVARVLQGTLQPAGGQMLAATPKGLGTGAIPSTAQQQSGNVVALPGRPTPPDGTPRRGPYGSGPGLGALLALAGSLLLGSTAWAQTPVPLDCGPLGVAVNSLGICIVPSSAGGEVFNLKTGSATNIGLMLGVAALHQDNLQLGGGFYCGAALALSAPNGGMCAALFTIKNYGAAGGGFLVYHDSIANQYVWQGLLMYAGTLHFGGTPSTIAAAKAKVSAETGK